ncbi:adenylate/guanylate cyclase domain-containing protein [Tistrella bauzanensis]|uniref:Adenylate/guanylate cyclase domain-containing protein n=1 Tax=Tistrella arctica TaxID=3133430 RepID=A0ABU9YKB6_9PROT
MSEVDQLLLAREKRGVRFALVARLGMLAIVFALHVLLYHSVRELVMVAALCGGAALGTLLLLIRLDRHGCPQMTGYLAAVLDVLVLSGLPVIWYIGTGADQVVGPQFFLQTRMTVGVLMVMVVNALAFRPAYPLVIAGAFTIIYGVLAGAILNDPRTAITTDPLAAMTGLGVAPRLVTADIVIVLTVALLLAVMTRVARGMAVQAVRLQHASDQLRRYFSPAVAARIAEGGDDFFRPGGVVREVAILFADIRGFTRLSAQMPPADVLDLLRSYHAEMVAVVFAHGGTLDKFIGDAIMVTFGSAEPDVNPARRALETALAMREALDRLNARRAAAGEVPLAQDIGVHVGPALVGNIGTPERLEHTVIGDTVNTASRIEAACKQHGRDLVVSDEVVMRAGDGFLLERLAPTWLAGKSEPMQLYAVTGHAARGDVTTTTRPLRPAADIVTLPEPAAAVAPASVPVPGPVPGPVPAPAAATAA